MTSVTRAYWWLVGLCLLCFLLGGGTAASLRVFLRDERTGAIRPDRDFDRLLRLTPEQAARRDALFREWNASLKAIQEEIKRIYYPRIQRVNREFSERLKREILTPEQNRLLEEYATGRRRLPRDE